MNPPLEATAARLERELKHARPLIACRFDPSSRFLFVSSEDESIQRFDLLTGENIALAGHKSWVRALAFVGSPVAGSGELDAWAKRHAGLHSIAGFGVGAFTPPRPLPFTLISGDYHGNLIWWQGDAPEPKPLRMVEAHQGWIRAVAVSPDGKTVASCGNDHAVKLWNAVDGKPIRTLEGHQSHVYNVAFHPDGNRPRLVRPQRCLEGLNLKTGASDRDLDAKALWKYDPGFMADIGARGRCSFPPMGPSSRAGITNVSNAFAGVGNPAVVLFDWKDGKSKLLKAKDNFQGTAWGVAFHPAGFVIAGGGGQGGGVWFWKGDDLASFHFVKLAASARDMALAPDGERFACAGSNGTAYIYSFTPGPAPMQPAPKNPAKK